LSLIVTCFAVMPSSVCALLTLPESEAMMINKIAFDLILSEYEAKIKGT